MTGAARHLVNLPTQQRVATADVNAIVAALVRPQPPESADDAIDSPQRHRYDPIA
jgi:hypothetical protein